MNTTLHQRFVHTIRPSGVRNLCVVALACALVAGCKDERRHQSSEHVAIKTIAPPAADNTSALAIGKLALTAMQELQTVRSEGLGIDDNQARYEAAMGRLYGVADQEYIYKAMKPNPNGRGGSPFAPTDITESAAVRKVVESWTSKTAYYLDGLKMDTLKVKSAYDKRAVVTVEATNAGEREMLKEIRSQSGMGSPDTPFKDLTKEQQEKIRTAALKQGFNVPIGAEIQLVLAQLDEGWRVQRVEVGPGK